MIIEAVKAVSGKNGRPYTVKAAVLDTVEGMKVGEKLTIEGLIDATGKWLPYRRISNTLSLFGGSRRFTMRGLTEPTCTIIRLPDAGTDDDEAPV